jgi:hypothetical protein
MGCLSHKWDSMTFATTERPPPTGATNSEGRKEGRKEGRGGEWKGMKERKEGRKEGREGRKGR